MSKTFEKHAITAEFAQKLVEAAVAKARELKVPQCVAIVDDGGNLKAFVRMDGAALIPIEIAQSKAYTALLRLSDPRVFQLHQGRPFAGLGYRFTPARRGFRRWLPDQSRGSNSRSNRRQRGDGRTGHAMRRGGLEAHTVIIEADCEYGGAHRERRCAPSKP